MLGDFGRHLSRAQIKIAQKVEFKQPTIKTDEPEFSLKNTLLFGQAWQSTKHGPRQVGLPSLIVIDAPSLSVFDRLGACDE